MKVRLTTHEDGSAKLVVATDVGWAEIDIDRVLAMIGIANGNRSRKSNDGPVTAYAGSTKSGRLRSPPSKTVICNWKVGR